MRRLFGFCFPIFYYHLFNENNHQIHFNCFDYFCVIKDLIKMDIVDIQAVESKLSDVTVTAIPMTPKQNTTTNNNTNTTNNNNNNNEKKEVPGQSKYAQLLGVIEEMGREVRPTYAGSKSSAERLKRGIVHARILVRECLMETERSARQ